MQTNQALQAFEALSSAVRLDVYRRVMAAGPDGLVAGDIAGQLGLAPSKLSFHLKALLAAGLLQVEQQGRFLRYRINLAQMCALIGFLTERCCDGHPEQCADVLPQLQCAGERCC